MILAAVAPVFLVVLVGYWIRHRRILTPDADASLLRICINVLYPCLIAGSILGNEALNQTINLWLPPLTGVLCIAAGYLAFFGGARLMRLPRGPETRTFVFVGSIYNYGYTAIPLVEELFGRKTLGVLFTHNLGVEIAFWIGAAFILSPHTAKADPGAPPLWQRILSPPVAAIIISLILNLFHVQEHLPTWVMGSLRLLGAAAIPLALLLTGATLADYMATLKISRTSVKGTIGASILRLAILPPFFLALAKWLPGGVELKQVLVVQSAMPCAMLPIVLTRHARGDIGMAIKIVVVTTLLAILTIPYWIALGMRWIGITPV